MRICFIMKGIIFIFLVVFLIQGSAANIVFPPEQGPYTGDYVFINEPGRYTLEENVTHSYPVGVIITSSSVILDGQNRYISPAKTGEPVVGIWITRTDSEGNPVTGVRVLNCNIEDEVTGIYVEGTDSSEFPWGSRTTEDNNQESYSNRDVKFTNVRVTGCRNGIGVYDSGKPAIIQSDIRNNEKGLIVSGGSPEIKDLVITNNSVSGITLQETSGGEISGCKIEGNTKAGIVLENVSGVRMWNNILDNYQNIESLNSKDVILNTTLINQTNIINGPVTGGNLWSQAGTPIYKSHQISDENLDGIGDSPYITDKDLTDYYPLIPPGTGFSPDNKVIQDIPEVRPFATPEPVSTPMSIITGIHAVISGDTIPAEMKTNTRYETGLTIVNDGSDDWLQMHAIGIKAYKDAAIWGPEWMPVPSDVPSKKSCTISFPIQTPDEPGTYELQYQAIRMGQGVSTTFGRPYKKVVTII